jgi:3'-phosphoadenosine 5'-phosphosulfate (PAPS) 3'-phosphatase
VLLEAGGRVIGTDGLDLHYNKADPLNTAFVATGCARIAADFSAILSPSLLRSRPPRRRPNADEG